MSPKTQTRGQQTQVTNCAFSGLGDRMEVTEELKGQVRENNIITAPLLSDSAEDVAFLLR